MRKTGLLFLLFHCITSIILGQTPQESPKITIQESRISVSDLLEEITRQGKVNFSFQSSLVDKEEIISFNIQDASLKETLDLLCEKLSVNYKQIDEIVILKRKKIKSITLSGFLSDALSGETLIGAVVFAKGTSIGTYTNEFGFYSLALKSGAHSIIYSHVGYERKEIPIVLDKAKQQHISLPPKSYELEEVVIAPTLGNILNKNALGEMELKPEQLNQMPEFGGESGLINGLQSLPGIKSHGDGSAYFHTRGGERDQNIIYIDDAPIYNPSHLFGFYSLVIPDFAKSITVHKSDMPATMGDRLSSIVSVRTQDGNLNKWEVSGAFNPFVNRLSLQIPVVKEKSSIFTTFRRSNFEWLYRRNNPGMEVYFNDFHFKWNAKFNDNNRVFFTVIFGSDVLQNTTAGNGRVGLIWANFASTLRWNHVFGPKLFSNTTLYTGNYGNRLFLTPNFWKSGLGMLSFKTDFTHYARQDYTAKFGVDLQTYFNDPGTISIDSSIAILPSLQPNHARKSAFYYQGKWDPTSKLRLNAGLRLILWDNLGPTNYFVFDEQNQPADTVRAGQGVYHNYTHLDPRFSVQYRLNSSAQLKLSFGMYHQYMQMINNSASPFTSLEIWLPANPNIRPQASRQWALSYVKYLEEPNMEVSVSAYHKKLLNQIDLEGHTLTYLNPLIEGDLRFGTSRSYGLELFVKKDLGRLHGWMSYTYSRVFRETEGINEGRVYPAFQDRPHDFSLFLRYLGKKRTTYSLYWTSYSGSTFSSPTGFFTYNNQSVPIYDEKNNDRFPAYHRVDVSAQIRLNKRETARYQHSLTLSINNFLAHKMSSQ